MRVGWPPGSTYVTENVLYFSVRINDPHLTNTKKIGAVSPSDSI